LQSFHRSFTYWSKQLNWKRTEIEKEEFVIHQEDPIYAHLADVYEELAAVIVENDDFKTFCLERAVEFRLMDLHIGLRMSRKEINCDPKICKYYDAIATIAQRQELEDKSKFHCNSSKTEAVFGHTRSRKY